MIAAGLLVPALGLSFYRLRSTDLLEAARKKIRQERKERLEYRQRMQNKEISKRLKFKEMSWPRKVGFIGSYLAAAFAIFEGLREGISDWTIIPISFSLAALLVLGLGNGFFRTVIVEENEEKLLALIREIEKEFDKYFGGPK